jgi:hypothetical protein
VKVPVRNAVLHRDDDGVRPEQLSDLVHDRFELMRLHREDHDVLQASVGVVVRRTHVARDVLAAVVHHQLDTVAANCVEVRAADDERHVLAGERKLRADVAADRSCANDRNLHRVLRHASTGSSS